MPDFPAHVASLNTGVLSLSGPRRPARGMELPRARRFARLEFPRHNPSIQVTGKVRLFDIKNSRGGRRDSRIAPDNSEISLYAFLSCQTLFRR
jgi:hypothetical protein